MSKKTALILSLGFIAAMAIVMYAMGREVMCSCGYIKLWHGLVQSSENSQHIFDWYTFTHIIHGLVFYLLISLFGKRLSFWQKLATAVFLESAWEVLENTDFIINRYREGTISLNYFGDSIINAIGDVAAMAAGFWFAAKKPVWMSLALYIVIEVFLLFWIRDNFTLNVIMILFPIEGIKTWQTGG